MSVLQVQGVKQIKKKVQTLMASLKILASLLLRLSPV